MQNRSKINKLEKKIIDFFLSFSANVKLPPEKFTTVTKEQGQQDVPTSSEPKKIILNSAEELYSEIRDKNFNAVGAVLSRKAKLITAQFDVRSTLIKKKLFISTIFNEEEKD